MFFTRSCLRSAIFLLSTLLTTLTSAVLTTYNEIVEPSADGTTTNSGLENVSLAPHSNATFLYITLWPGRDHTALLADFDTFVSLYGPAGIPVVPRVNYHLDAPIPDVDTLKADVNLWATKIASVTSKITIPVLQAGFLGLWGEWHGWPIADAVPANLDLKRFIISTLQDTTGLRVAIRYPKDHRDLHNPSWSAASKSDVDRTVTLHNDCIYAGGATGGDGGTFDSIDDLSGSDWRAYSVAVAGSGNWYGGEGCDNVGEENATDWNDVNGLCDATTGYAAYIKEMSIMYLNTDYPDGFKSLMGGDVGTDECRAGILAAMG